MAIFTCPSLENWCEMFTVRTKYGGMVAKIATPVAILAGIFIVWPYVRRTWKRKTGHKVLTRSMSLAALHGGKLALERLADYHRARADASTLHAAEMELSSLLCVEHPDYNRLQSVIAKLEMSGNDKVAIEMLEKEMNDAKTKGKTHEAYETGMLLVEMYIYQGEFNKALQCDCLSHGEISDARRPLYKAISNLTLGKKVEAEKCWGEFSEIQRHFQFAPETGSCQLHKPITDFNEFEKAVDVLKTDISEASKKPKKQ